MSKLLLSIHVLAAILTVGPVAVAASVFPRYAGDARIAVLLHRVCRVYAVVGLAVPVFGLATAGRMGVLTDGWLLVSIALTVLAAGILALLVLPGQRRLLATPEARADAGRLAMTTGIFNLVWAVVVVLMIVRPGSTTGA